MPGSKVWAYTLREPPPIS